MSGDIDLWIIWNNVLCGVKIMLIIRFMDESMPWL